MGPLRRLTRTIPIVFTETSDPVGAGFVESLARPGGNVTGFLTFEYGLSATWLELLKLIAPHVTRVAVLRDAAIPSGTGQWGATVTAVCMRFGFPTGTTLCFSIAGRRAPHRFCKCHEVMPLFGSSWLWC